MPGGFALQKTGHDRQSVFSTLMEAVKTRALGQVSHVLYDVVRDRGVRDSQ